MAGAITNRILLVEDDRSLRFGVSHYLQRSGFVVAEAATCAGARDSFRAFNPDVVLMDHRLPDGDGIELVAEFRKENAALPVIVFTGFGSIDLAVRAVKCGAETLLTKPIDLGRLGDELQRALHTAADACAGDSASSVLPRPSDAFAASVPARDDVAGSTLRALERSHIEHTMTLHAHVGDAARTLGISRSSLYVKLKAYGLLPSRRPDGGSSGSS